MHPHYLAYTSGCSKAETTIYGVFLFVEIASPFRQLELPVDNLYPTFIFMAYEVTRELQTMTSDKTLYDLNIEDEIRFMIIVCFC